MPSFSHELLDILWPRFNYVLEMNIASVRETDPQKLGNIDTSPHYVSNGPVLCSAMQYVSLYCYCQLLTIPFPDHPPLC